MRVWEVDDVKALPGDIVREQDFIMRLRHLQRQNAQASVINLAFGGAPELQSKVEEREDILRQLAPIVAAARGQLHIMSQGDAFIIAPDTGKQRDHILSEIGAALTQRNLTEGRDKLVHAYNLPQDYAAARERTNYYIEVARAAAQIGAADTLPEQALQSEQVRGALTPWALDQIVKLFGAIDIRRYVRSQSIYRHTPGGWEDFSKEYFVSVDELRRERFPRLDIRTPEHLFMELCGELDHRLLHQFAETPGSLASGPLHLNVAVESVLGARFAKFSQSLPSSQRRQMAFEINRGDLLLNFFTTKAAIELLHNEGYKIAIDALHPAMLPYLNSAAFGADYLKIRLSKDMVDQLQDKEVAACLRQLPREKIIFYRCDSEAALEIGKQFGISLFQGWYIDDVAGR